MLMIVSVGGVLVFGFVNVCDCSVRVLKLGGCFMCDVHVLFCVY